MICISLTLFVFLGHWFEFDYLSIISHNTLAQSNLDVKLDIVCAKCETNMRMLKNLSKIKRRPKVYFNESNAHTNSLVCSSTKTIVDTANIGANLVLFNGRLRDFSATMAMKIIILSYMQNTIEFLTVIGVFGLFMAGASSVGCNLTQFTRELRCLGLGLHHICDVSLQEDNEAAAVSEKN